jgi:Mycobacterium membrane protein
MKQLMLFTLLTFLVVSSCTKEPQVDEVTYEVTLTSATSWHGAYLNEDAQVVSISTAPTNWTHKFKNNNELVAVTLQAYADGTSSTKDATMKIYVNGTVVAQGKSSVSPQIQYIFP